MPGEIQRHVKDKPRCGAKTRAGTPCRRVKAKGRTRCHMHGGADGSGAQPGNQSALRNGVFTVENRTLYKRLARIYREMRDGNYPSPSPRERDNSGKFSAPGKAFPQRDGDFVQRFGDSLTIVEELTIF